MLQARALVSPMSNEEDQLTELMALFEGEFFIDWILEISGCKAIDVLGIIDELNNSGVIKSRCPGVYCFKDPKKRLQLLEAIDTGKRDIWHRSISEILFRDIPDQQDAGIRASVHLLHLTNDEKTCRYLLDAGDIYRKANQYQKALRCYLKILHDLDKSDTDEAYGISIRAIIGYTKLFMVDPDVGAVVPLLEKAILKAQERNNTGEAALIMMNLAMIEWTFTDIDTAIEHFNEGWRMAQTVDEPRLRGSSILFNSFFRLSQGRIRDVVENYEQIHSDVDRYPTNIFPLMAANNIATCYAYNGQIKRGVAMLEGLFDEYRNKEDAYASCYTGILISSVFIEMGQLDEAIQHLEFILEKAVQAISNTHISLINLTLAFAHYRKNNVEKSLEYLKASVKLRRQKNITNNHHIYHKSELFWAMELGDYPVVKGLSISEEVNRDLESNNILIKGIAYRYRSLIDERNGASRKTVLKWMLGSEALLEESGHELQLARTRMELARIYLFIGDEKKAKQVIQKSSEVLNSFMQNQVPDDLRFLLKDLRTDKNLLEEIMKLGQDLVAIPSFRDLLRHILAAVNQVTGAERGAVFFLNGTEKNPEIELRAARNLTAVDIQRPDFSSSMEMIRASIASGEPQIYLSSPPVKIDLRKKKDIHSRICVPLKIRQQTVGVLYVDNRIFPSAFKESDIRILTFFSSVAAIALENTLVREEKELLRQRLEKEKTCRRQTKDNTHLATVEFVGESNAVKQLLKDTEKVAQTDATVLILGETGVGKELIAGAIHQHSQRCRNAFVRVNCSAFPESLIASELFGHEKGAFTGAIEKRIGRFEMADGGTLFLDEIGDISHEVQLRLLRVLQSKEFERVGGRRTIRSDFRLVAATHQNLQESVAKGKFREDLFYRLNVLSIKIPPLRERKEDIPFLIDYFLKQYAQKHGKPICNISGKDIEKLVLYDWPGNVRELKNVIERGAILSPGADFVIPEFYWSQTAYHNNRTAVTLAENEKQHILWALKKTGGKVRGAGGVAELLDINHNTLYSRMKKLGIKPSA